jgi:hypothetical protein
MDEHLSLLWRAGFASASRLIAGNTTIQSVLHFGLEVEPDLESKIELHALKRKGFQAHIGISHLPAEASHYLESLPTPALTTRWAAPTSCSTLWTYYATSSSDRISWLFHQPGTTKQNADCRPPGWHISQGTFSPGVSGPL